MFLLVSFSDQLDSSAEALDRVRREAGTCSCSRIADGSRDWLQDSILQSIRATPRRRATVSGSE